MNTKQMIEVMQAYEDGAEIESTGKFGDKSCWTHIKDPTWSWNTDLYRIKRRPQTATLYYYRMSGGEVKIFTNYAVAVEYLGRPPTLIKTETIELPE